uniref:Putative secreted protein n=1 Tax=Panstrongylus lignarius TaxID=156445 RepID=A0A224XSA6_9HEMI
MSHTDFALCSMLLYWSFLHLTTESARAISLAKPNFTRCPPESAAMPLEETTMYVCIPCMMFFIIKFFQLNGVPKAISTICLATV